jgi:hypothetical protein
VDLVLTWIKLGNVHCGLLHLCIGIVELLFCYQMVANNVLPMTSNLWHILELSQISPSMEQYSVNEEETKVIDLILCSLLDIMSVLKLILQVITDVLSKSIPEMGRIRRRTVEEKGGKELPELWSSLHACSLLQTDIPLLIIFQKTPGQTGSLESGIHSTSKDLRSSNEVAPLTTVSR